MAGLVVVSVALLIGVGIASISKPHDVSIAPDAAVVQEAPAGPSVVCTHEVCGERPAYLLGSDCSGGACSRYRVTYEHHCDCDAWAPALDGGVER